MNTPLATANDQGGTYYPALTALRGIFIMMIVLFHIRDMFAGCLSAILGPVYTYGGYLGNWFFFMLSGFLASHTCLEKIGARQVGFFRFFGQRLWRVYPLYFLTNLYMFFYRLYSHMLSTTTGWKNLWTIVLPVSWGWIENIYPYNQPTWFINILLQCWAVYYFVVRLSARRRILFVSLLGGISLWGFMLILANMQLPFCYMQNGEGVFNFFLGAGLYEVFRIARSTAAKIRFSVLGGTAGLIFILCVSYWHFSSPSARSIGPVLALLINPAAILCALLAPPVKRLLGLSALHQLGRISMSIYFWHSPIALTYLSIRNWVPLVKLLPMVMHFVVFWVLLLLISGMSYYSIECPIKPDGGKKNFPDSPL